MIRTSEAVAGIDDRLRGARIMAASITARGTGTGARTAGASICQHNRERNRLVLEVWGARASASVTARGVSANAPYMHALAHMHRHIEAH